MPEQEKEKQPKQSEQVEPENKKLSDEDLVSLIQGYAAECEAFYDEWYSEKWDYLRNRYLGIREKAASADDWHSNMTMNRGFGIVTSDAANSIGGLYADSDFFSLKPRLKKHELAVTAIEKLMYTQQPNMKIYPKFYQALLDALVFGTGWIKFTWNHSVKTKFKYNVVDGTVKGKRKVKKVSEPFISVKAPQDVWFDQDAEDIDDIQYFLENEFILVSDIRNKPKTYNKEEGRAEFLKAYDEEDGEKAARVRCRTYWTDDEVATITVDGGHLIRRHGNMYGIPFRPIIKYPDSRNVLGIGSIEAVSDILDFIDDLMNSTADNMLLSMLKVFMVKGSSDLDVDERDLYPGAFMRVKSFEEIQTLNVGSTNTDWINGSNAMDENINKVIGNIDQQDSPATQTAYQSREIAQRAKGKYAAFAKYNRENFLKWFIEKWIEYDLNFLEPQDMIDRIGEDEVKNLQISAEVFANADDIDFNIIITGDTGLEDSQTAIMNINTALDTILKISQLPPTSNVDTDILIKYTISKSNLPEGTYKSIEVPTDTKTTPEEEQSKSALQEEITQAAQAQGVTPERFIEAMAAKYQTSPEQLLADIKDNGGTLAAFEKQIAESVKSKGTEVATA